jgi:hypothetical protein
MNRSMWLGLALLTIAPVHRADAGSTAKWVVDGYEQFDEGEAEDAFITSTGEVRPGWETDSTEIETGGAWAAVKGEGGVVYVGTDDKATIVDVKPGDKPKKLASIEGAVAVVALAIGPGGAVYAGTMPGGQIWRVDRGASKAVKVADLKGAETVWSLAFARSGALYAGTGPDGKLFKVDAKTGSAKVVFSSEDKRILSMVATDDGAIWFGTSDDALLFRHDPAKGTTRAMADFAGNEVTALAELKGAVIAAANEIKEPSTTGVKTEAAVKEAEGKGTKGEKTTTPEKKPGADKATPSGAEPERKGERKGKGSLFRVRGDGQLEELHALSQTYFTSVAVNDAGQVFAGAGDKGRVYLIDVDDSVSTAFDVGERQVVAVLPGKSGVGLTFVTGDGTKVYRSKGRASKATYTSKVFDGGAPARFGSMSWRGAGGVAIETRSGNTEEPGPGWSEWQKPRDPHAAGGGATRGKLSSPPGRYVQFRARLSNDDAALSSALVYYLPQNRATRLEEVTVTETSATKLATLEQNASTPRSPVVKLKWKVENDDGDETVYKLAVRREGDVRWRPISTGTGKPLTATNFDWNTETYPDGHNRLRVTASDGRANAESRALETSRISGVFAVDNQKPTIAGITVKYPAASARASDAVSALSEMAWSVDDGPWQLGASQDGLFDDTAEGLAIRLPDDLEPGVHTLAIRVADEAGNTGSAAVTFRVQ